MEGVAQHKAVLGLHLFVLDQVRLGVEKLGALQAVLDPAPADNGHAAVDGLEELERALHVDGKEVRALRDLGHDFAAQPPDVVLHLLVNHARKQHPHGGARRVAAPSR